jgi:hypothetical protein
VVVTDVFGFGDEAMGVALQPDGKVVVGGAASNGTDDDFAVVRYEGTGLLDASFAGGSVATDLGGTDVAVAVGLQRDHRVALVGHTTVAGTVDLAAIRVFGDPRAARAASSPTW